MQLLHQQPGHEDAVVFHAQQCLEKYFKAALIAHWETVQKIHDSGTLQATRDPDAGLGG